jgi:hypothetical protein
LTSLNAYHTLSHQPSCPKKVKKSVCNTSRGAVHAARQQNGGKWKEKGVGKGFLTLMIGEKTI